eukprot:221561-Hanusia_phi.AAC.2
MKRRRLEVEEADLKSVLVHERAEGVEHATQSEGDRLHDGSQYVCSTCLERHPRHCPSRAISEALQVLQMTSKNLLLVQPPRPLLSPLLSSPRPLLSPLLSSFSSISPFLVSPHRARPSVEERQHRQAVRVRVHGRSFFLQASHAIEASCERRGTSTRISELLLLQHPPPPSTSSSSSSSSSTTSSLPPSPPPPPPPPALPLLSLYLTSKLLESPRVDASSIDQSSSRDLHVALDGVAPEAPRHFQRLCLLLVLVRRLAQLPVFAPPAQLVSIARLARRLRPGDTQLPAALAARADARRRSLADAAGPGDGRELGPALSEVGEERVKAEVVGVAERRKRRERDAEEIQKPLVPLQLLAVQQPRPARFRVGHLHRMSE